MRPAPALAMAIVASAPLACAGSGQTVTDDARIVDAHSCQLESWSRRNAGSTELWALAGCNPRGNLEITLGGARTWAEGASRLTDQQLQAKTILRPLAQDGWGIAFTAGTTRHRARDGSTAWPGDAYLNVPLSIALLPDDAWLAHLDAGVLRQRDAAQTLGTWGFANEIRLASALFIIPEIFRSEAGRPFYQLGLRYALVPGRVQLSAAGGDRVRAHSGEHWFSVGLQLVSAPFLP